MHGNAWESEYSCHACVSVYVQGIGSLTSNTDKECTCGARAQAMYAAISMRYVCIPVLACEQ